MFGVSKGANSAGVFELQFGSLYFDDIDYLIKIPARTDIVPRLTNASANNLIGKFAYRFVRVKTL